MKLLKTICLAVLSSYCTDDIVDQALITKQAVTDVINNRVQYQIVLLHGLEALTYTIHNMYVLKIMQKGPIFDIPTDILGELNEIPVPTLLIEQLDTRVSLLCLPISYMISYRDYMDMVKTIVSVDYYKKPNWQIANYTADNYADACIEYQRKVYECIHNHTDIREQDKQVILGKLSAIKLDSYTMIQQLWGHIPSVQCFLDKGIPVINLYKELSQQVQQLQVQTHRQAQENTKEKVNQLASSLNKLISDLNNSSQTQKYLKSLALAAQAQVLIEQITLELNSQIIEQERLQYLDKQLEYTIQAIRNRNPQKTRPSKQQACIEFLEDDLLLFIRTVTGIQGEIKSATKTHQK